MIRSRSPGTQEHGRVRRTRRARCASYVAEGKTVEICVVEKVVRLGRIPIKEEKKPPVVE